MTTILTLAASLLLLGPVTLETGKLTISQNGKKIGSEEFTVSERNGGGYVLTSKTELSGDPAALSSRLEVDDNLVPVAYEYAHGKGTIHIKVAQPVSEYSAETDGKKTATEFRFPENGFILDNNFFSHYVMLLYRVGDKGGTVPIFVPQDLQLGVATVKRKEGNVYVLDMGPVTMEATTDRNGKMIKLSVPSAKVVVER